MDRRARIAVVGRRDVIVGAGAGAAVLALLGAEGVRAQGKVPGNGLDEALRRITGGGKPAEGRVMMDFPDVNDSGNTVPYTLSVASPMTETSYVKALHVLASGNPQSQVASFEMTPLSGRAQVTSRLRLARSQEVVAVAELSDGRFIVSRRMVKVTIGGCGG